MYKYLIFFCYIVFVSMQIFCFILLISNYVISQNGIVITWGGDDYGGNSSSVTSELSSDAVKVYSTNSKICCFNAAFAVIKIDGSVISCGDSTNGGDSSSVTSDLSFGVSEVFSTYGAFAALKSNGSVITWGSFKLGSTDTNNAINLMVEKF